MGTLLDAGDKVSSIYSALLATVTLVITVKMVPRNRSESVEIEDETERAAGRLSWQVNLIHPWPLIIAVALSAIALLVGVSSKNSSLVIVGMTVGGVAAFVLGFFVERRGPRLCSMALGLTVAFAVPMGIAVVLAEMLFFAD